MLNAGNELHRRGGRLPLAGRRARRALAPYLGTVVAVVRDEHLEVGHDLAAVADRHRRARSSAAR